MSLLARTILLLVSAAMAIGGAWLVHEPNFGLIPEAPFGAVVLMAVLAWGMWFAVLFPVWLPAVVPSGWFNTMRVVSILCGGLLLLSSVILLWLQFFPTWQDSVAILTLTATGAWHLTHHSRRGPPASSELQH